MPNSVHRVSVYVEDKQVLTLTGPPISVAPSRDGRTSDMFDLWFEHIEDMEPRDYTLYVLGTGHPAPWSDPMDRSAFRFIGTVVTPIGLVWHVYLYVPEVAAAWKQSMAVALGTPNPKVLSPDLSQREIASKSP